MRVAHRKLSTAESGTNPDGGFFSVSPGFSNTTFYYILYCICVSLAISIIKYGPSCLKSRLIGQSLLFSNVAFFCLRFCRWHVTNSATKAAVPLVALCKCYVFTFFSFLSRITIVRVAMIPFDGERKLSHWMYGRAFCRARCSTLSTSKRWSGRSKWQRTPVCQWLPLCA